MLDLGEAYMATGRIAQAEDVLQQVLNRTSYCPDQAWAKMCYVDVCGELSMLYLAEGNFPSAQLMAERGVAYGEARGIDTLAAKTRLCLVYQYIGRWEDALALANKVFNTRARDKRQGPTHHSTWKAEAELAYIRARLGEVDAAERVFTDIAQKFENTLGKDHYDTLVARTNLAWIYHVQHRFGEAELIQREVLEKGRSVLGSDHAYTLYMMLRLGVTLGESGKLQEAIDILTKCQESRKELLGELHPAWGAAAVWRTIFLWRRDGYDPTNDLSERDMEMFELGKQYAEFPFTPVQI
ncbi:hypothetical protein VUR80DRAFT_2013 [Thermomyces stellatus]